MHCSCSKKYISSSGMRFLFLFLPSAEGIFIASFLFVIVLLLLFCCSEFVITGDNAWSFVCSSKKVLKRWYVPFTHTVQGISASTNNRFGFMQAHMKCQPDEC